MDDSIRSLIFQAIDQTISAEDFERLQDAIEQSDEVRSGYLTAVRLCESLSEIAGEEESSSRNSEPMTSATGVAGPILRARPDAGAFG